MGEQTSGHLAEARAAGQIGPVRRDVNATQNDLAVAIRGEFRYLAHDLADWHRTAVAAAKGNYAERAHEVTSVLNFQVGPLLKIRIADKTNAEIITTDPFPYHNRTRRLFIGQVIQEIQLVMIANDIIDPIDHGDSVGSHLRITPHDNRNGPGVFSNESSDGVS